MPIPKPHSSNPMKSPLQPLLSSACIPPALSLQKKLALGFVLAATFSSAAQAASVNWIGNTSSSANWADTANWSTGALPSNTDGIVFNVATYNNSTEVISLGGSQTVSSLTFSTANSPYTIGSAADIAAGYSLTLTNIYRSSISGGQQSIAANVTLANDAYWEIASGYNSSLLVTGTISGDGLSLTKASNGTLDLAAANTYNGGTIVKQGTLSLLFNQATSPTNDILANGSTLTMYGGSVSMKGKASKQNSQTFGKLQVVAGASSLSLSATNSTNSVLMNLGSIERSTGATITFNQPTGNTTIGAANGYTTSTGNDSSGILGAWATISGSTWATNNGTNIVAYTGYTDLSGDAPSLVDGATSNVRINSASTGNVGQSAGVTSVNTILVNDTTARTITIGAGNTLRLGPVGGILAAPGAGALTIGASGNAGTLTAGGSDNTTGEIIVTSATSVTVNSVIADNGTGAVSLTKSGAGVLTLAAGNTYSGGTYVNSGTLILSAGTDRLNAAGNITVSGGVLNLGTSTQNTSGSVTVAGGTISGGTIIKTGSAYDAQAGTMAGIFGGSVGLTKTTQGWVTFSGTGTYTGNTQVLEGTLSLSANAKLNSNIYVGSVGGTTSASFSAAQYANISSKDVTVYANGSFSLGNSVHVGNLTIYGGSASSSFGYVDSSVTMTGGVLSGNVYGGHYLFTIKASDTTAVISAGNSMATTNTYNVENGAAAVDLQVTGAISGNYSIVKSGNGLMSIEAGSGYTGTTTVNGGILQIGNGTAGSISASGTISVASGATVAFNQADGTSYAGVISTSGTVKGMASGTNTLSGQIKGTGSVVQAGPGTTILSGTNIYSGGTVVSSGTLLLGYGSALGTGTTTVSGGALNLGGYGVSTVLGTVTGGSVENGTVTNNGGYYDLRSGSISASLAGSNGLHKTTSGTASLSNAHTYTGATTVSEGVLELKAGGALGNTSSVNVASGATFTNNGSVASAVTVAGRLTGSGSTGAVVLASGTVNGTLSTGGISGTGLVSPGNSPGILTATSVTSTLADGLLQFAFELTAAAPNYADAANSLNDVLLVTSANGLTLEAGTNISVYFESLSAGTLFDGGFFLANATTAELLSAISNATFTFYVQDAQGTTLFNDINYTLVNRSLIDISAVSVSNAAFESGSVSGAELEFTVVPEPSTWAMATGGFGLLAFGQRLRRKLFRA